MPGFATSTRTRDSATRLMEAFGVDAGEIDIRPACMQMLKDIGHPFATGKQVFDVTFENVQAGQRTSTLFRLANLRRALVVGTGVIAALVVGGILMIAVDRWRKRSHWNRASGRGPAELRPGEALLVGGMQCLAMWPGTSRSMMTIVGGYCVGLKPAQAAEFSFLLGLPTLAGAALLKGIKGGPAMLEVFGWQPVVLGTVVAFVSAALAIKVLVATLTRFGLTPFAIYRILLAAALAFMLFT